MTTYIGNAFSLGMLDEVDGSRTRDLQVEQITRRDRYNLYRCSEYDRWCRLGCELPLGYCRRIISEREPNGTSLVPHTAQPYKVVRSKS